MNEQHIDALFQRAAGLSRRGSLAALGSAGLAVLAGPSITTAKKPGKKAKRRARKKGEQKCKKQVDQCVAVFEDLCTTVEDPEACEAQFIPCCPLFAQCKVDAFIDCAFELV
jgi:hypothetical protein